MKQLDYHKVMDPQFLFLLVSNVALLVRLMGGHNASFKLTIILGGRGPPHTTINNATKTNQNSISEGYMDFSMFSRDCNEQDG